jgi:hypothetical protein
MKNILILTSVFAVSFLLMACPNGTEPEPAADGDAGSMSATINGVPWTSTVMYDNSIKISKSISGLNEKSHINLGFTIEAANAVAGKVITISRSNVYEGLTYKLFSADNFSLIESDVAGSGTITITKATGKVLEGTFSTKGPKQTITDGKFSITLSKFY